MEYETFVNRMKASLPAGTVMENPGGGTSAIAWIDDDRLCYVRGNARFYVRFRDLHGAYERFAGKDVTTTRLKAFAPEVFDSARRGHNCNCTVLFLALQRIGLAGEIWGKGRRGAPFGVTLKGCSDLPPCLRP